MACAALRAGGWGFVAGFGNERAQDGDGAALAGRAGEEGTSETGLGDAAQARHGGDDAYHPGGAASVRPGHPCGCERTVLPIK